jgi:hypothetical protein
VGVNRREYEGLLGLMGENVTLFCLNYIYTGKLVGVNDTFVKLEGASVVYETGSFSDPTFKDSQKLPHDWYVQLSSVESFGKLK